MPARPTPVGRAVVVTAAVLTAWPCAAADLYVSPRAGDDANPGTLVAPVATARRAAELATPGDAIHVVPDDRPPAAAPPPRRQVPIVVSWPDGAGPEPVPLYCGVAFPRGVLPDPARVRVVDGTGAEVSCQVEPLCRWHPDPSVRWAGVRFRGRPGTTYAVEFGTAVTRAATSLLTVADRGGQFEVDTGAARFEVPKTGPLLGRAWVGRTPVLAGGRPCLVLADHTGRTADETGGGPAEAAELEAAGPECVTVRREGLLRTAAGERLGKYVVRLSFFAGSPAAHLQHTFVVTEDTEQVRFADLAVRLPTAAGGPATGWVAADADPAVPPHREALDLTAGDGLFALQADYPHHGQRTYRREVAVRRGRVWRPVERWTGGGVAEGRPPAVGNWAAVAGADGGAAVVVPHLAHLFPKELAVGPDGLTAHLWSGRGGRPLDYRPAALVDFWGVEWVNRAYPGGEKAMRAVKAPAVGTGRTHDLWVHLFAGPDAVAAGVPAAARLAENPPLAVQDPTWLRDADALVPLHPVDRTRFPRAETFLRTLVADYMAGEARRFGDYGFLDHGCGAHTYTAITALPGATLPRLNYRYADHHYHSHVALWYAYARSGDRLYRDHAAALARHFADFKVCQFAAAGRPLGSRLSGNGSEDNPYYWAGTEGPYPAGVLTGHQGEDPQALALFHYLTGDRRALDVFRLFGERFKAFDMAVLPNIGANSNGAQPALAAAALYEHTGDGRYRQQLLAWIDRQTDLRTSTGIADPDYYGAWEKWPVKQYGVLRAYQVTGSLVARAAFLKGAELLLRDLPDNTTGYQDHSGLFAATAHRLTGDRRYADWLADRLDRLLFEYLDDAGTVRVTSPARGGPHKGGNSAYNVIETLCVGLDLVARTEAGRRRWVQLDAGLPLHPVEVYFRKGWHEPAEFDLRFDGGADLANTTDPGGRNRPYRGGHVGPVHWDARPSYYTAAEPGLGGGYATLRMPPETVAGEYRLTGVPLVFRHTPRQVVLVARDGFLARGTSDRPPVYYFRLPAGKSGRVYANKAATLDRGGVSTPVTAGEWVALTGGPADELVALRVKGLTYVRVDGHIPPVFAQDDPGRFFVPAAVADAPPEPPPPPPAGPFADGLTGGRDRAVVLLPGKGLEIPRGRPVGDRRYEHLDYARGTLEFWFRPRWTTGMGSESADRTVLGGGVWPVGRWHNASDDDDHRMRTAWVHTAAATVAPPQRLVNSTPVRAGRWHHFALCWTTDPARGWLSELYLDGKPASGYTRHKVGPGRYLETEPAKLLPPRPWGVDVPKGEAIRLLGALDADVDELRVSAAPRYLNPFPPPQRRPFDPDADTLLLLRFDGDLKPVVPAGASAPTVLLK